MDKNYGGWLDVQDTDNLIEFTDLQASVNYSGAINEQCHIPDS